MRPKILSFLLAGLVLGSDAFAADRWAVRILRRSTGSVETIPIEDYVAGVLPSEMGVAPPAALEAQAIAARSFALAHLLRHQDDKADLCDSVHCQVFRGIRSATPASSRAAQATRGPVLVQGGRVIGAPFHAVCGGRTTRPVDVWDDEEVPAIAAVDDDACLAAPGARWTFRLSRESVARLGAQLGLPGARFLEVYGRNADGRVTMVRLVAPGGKAVAIRGFDFRQIASSLWGWSSVRSTAFTVEELRHEYVLSGHGTGHGAGLCQAGAMARARRGETRDQILGLYYRGAAVARLESVMARR